MDLIILPKTTVFMYASTHHMVCILSFVSDFFVGNASYVGNPRTYSFHELLHREYEFFSVVPKNRFFIHGNIAFATYELIYIINFYFRRSSRLYLLLHRASIRLEEIEKHLDNDRTLIPTQNHEEV